MGLERLTPELDRLVDEGALVGWVAGLRAGRAAEILAGGHRRLGGPAMTPDTQFAMASVTKPIAGALALRVVQQGVLGFDDPVDPWLPELAAPRVLRRPDGPLDDTVDAERPITLRHLLTMTPGFGYVTEGGPLAAAMEEQQVAPGPFAPPMSPEEYLARLGALPLADQPGSTWRYHTSSDVLGVLLARATGQPVHGLLSQHVTGPLTMADTGFVGDPDRMATAYGPGADGLEAYFMPEGAFTAPPVFESLATGLVSTAADQLAFLATLANDAAPILRADLVETMRSDQLTGAQREGASAFLADGSGWGHHTEVRPDGWVGWAGGLGTIGYADPRSRRAAVLFTQCSVDTPGTQAAFEAFWSAL